MMRAVARGLLVLILAVALARAACYLAYSGLSFPTPGDAFFLESTMVHFAWRARAGVTLYPAWDHYPYVANFYAPGYFALVGWIGRAVGAGYEGLYLIGRGVTVASALGTTLLLGLAIRRRAGRGAAILGMAIALGVGPLFGFGLMARPDTLAEFLGVAGFLLVGGRRAPGAAAGGVLLGLAALTKQTAAVYALAGVIGLALEGRRRRALALLIGVPAGVGAAALAIQLAIEPRFLACLLGEAGTPSDFAAWWPTVRKVAVVDPELFVLAAAGLAAWGLGPRREPRAASLAVLLLGSALAISAKRGSDSNYFLGLRAVAALAAADLWRAAWGPEARPRAWQVLAMAATLAALLPGALYARDFLAIAGQVADYHASPAGRESDRLHRDLFAMARDPSRRILTDVGAIDIRQGERTLSADPYRFKVMVEGGQIDPLAAVDRLDRGDYELIVTKRDLFSPTYADDTFGLPQVLADAARRRYEPVSTRSGLFFYRPRAPSGGPIGR